MKHYFQKLTETVRAHWDSPALSDFRGKSWTYGEMAAAIETLHLAFRKAGLVKGDKVALCAGNSAHWAQSYLAIVTYGTVAVPILPNFTPEGVTHLVDHSESVLLLADPSIAKTLDFDAMPHLKAILSAEDFSVLKRRDEKVVAAIESRKALFTAAHPNGFLPEDVAYPTDNDDDLAVVNYTSGTTSAPKGVMLCHRGFTHMIEFAQTRIPVEAGENIVSMLPMAHMYGLAFELLYPIISGVTVHYLGKMPSPSTLMAAMADIRPYIVITVPLVMEKIYRTKLRPALSKPAVRLLMALPGIGALLRRKVRRSLMAAFGGNIRHFIMGGAPLNPEAEACFRKIGLPYTVGYGMTEACPLLAYEDSRRYVQGSCGKPIDCDEMRIDSPDPIRVVGEIQAKGPNICLGYFKDPAATAALFTPDGFLRTGDLGHFDRKGNVFICGRSKNMILSATGQNIYPEEIEAVVNQQDFVVESVVVSRDTRLVARVFLDEDALAKAGLTEADIAALPEKIRAAVNESMPGYSKLAAVERNPSPFEKTPKMSIKRFLYS